MIRLGASAPTAGPRRRVLCHPLQDWQLPRPRRNSRKVPDSYCSAVRALKRLLAVRKAAVTSFHRELGTGIMHRATRRSSTAPALREEFWKNVTVPGSGPGAQLNDALEGAAAVRRLPRVRRAHAALDALDRDESCGSHFRAESQMADGEAKRDEENFAHWPRGSTGRRKHNRPAQGASRPSSCTSREARGSGVTNEDHVANLAAEEGRRVTPESFVLDGRQRGDVVSRDALCAQRAVRRQGRGPGRLRPRLPLGIRGLRRRDQRPGP